MFPSRRAPVATTVFSMLGFTTAPVASAAEATFRCDPGFYQVISDQLIVHSGGDRPEYTVMADTAGGMSSSVGALDAKGHERGATLALGG